MNKYKVVTVDGPIELEADGIYYGGMGGKDLTFYRTGEWVEPAPAAIPRAGQLRNYIDPVPAYGGYNKTEYVAGFNGDYWKSYTIVDVPAAA